nr:hypothetical protein [Streptacidiphilus fuscans]
MEADWRESGLITEGPDQAGEAFRAERLAVGAGEHESALAVAFGVGTQHGDGVLVERDGARAGLALWRPGDELAVTSVQLPDDG